MYSVVVVDDKITIQDSLKKHITHNIDDFEICNVFSDGEKALEYIKENPDKVDVVITDIIPNKSGMSLARKIYEQRIDAIVVFLSEIREFEFAKQAIKYNVFAYLEKPVDFDEFDEVFEKIKKDLNKKKYSNHEGLIEEQKLLNMEYLSEDIDEINENCSITIKKSLRWIDKNYDKNITLSDAANHVMLSSVYYGRVFKSNVGISFTSYLLDYRLNKARQLLKETMYNVREISMLVGYKDVNYFIRLFKKKYGVSPNEFKKQKQIE